MADLTHFDSKGAAHMVDVGGKSVTSRLAVARGFVAMGPTTLALVAEGRAGKGDVLGVARLAGIMAAKKTSDLIPLCHPLALTSVSIDFALEDSGIVIEARAATSGQTGVEMEALTAASIAALTIYDMLKSAEKSMVISDIRLVMKEGGKSGRYEAG